MIAATNDAKKSLEGNDTQTPFKLKKCGRITSSGIKNSNWRERDKKNTYLYFTNTLKEVLLQPSEILQQDTSSCLLNSFNCLAN